MSFGEKYSEVYDIIYSDKDYKKECDFLEEIFSKFGSKISSILDLGCGSGGHSVILSDRGYKIVGVDKSPHMIKRAKEKAKSKNLDCTFLEHDIRYFKTNTKFDAVISMFAVASYQTENEDVISFFKTAFDHLRSGGLFTFDFWFGPAVLREKPQVKIKEINQDDLKIIRITEPKTDILNNTVDVNFKVFIINRNNNVVEEFEEKHKMRFFFAKEIKYMLENVGFHKVNFFPFLDLSREPTDSDWNISCISIKP